MDREDDLDFEEFCSLTEEQRQAQIDHDHARAQAMTSRPSHLRLSRVDAGNRGPVATTCVE